MAGSMASTNAATAPEWSSPVASSCSMSGSDAAAGDSAKDAFDEGDSEVPCYFAHQAFADCVDSRVCENLEEKLETAFTLCN